MQTTSCSEIQSLMNARFDDGDDPTRDLKEHLESCPQCRQHAGKLLALSGELHELSLMEANPNLRTRVQAQIVSDKPLRRSKAPFWILAASITALAAGGWFVRIPLNFGNSWSKMDLDVLSSPWREAMASLSNDAQRFWAGLLDAVEPFVPASSFALWATFAGVAILLTAFNGFEAHAIRVEGGHPPVDSNREDLN